MATWTPDMQRMHNSTPTDTPPVPPTVDDRPLYKVLPDGHSGRLLRPVYIDVANVARSAADRRNHSAFSGVFELVRSLVSDGHCVHGFMADRRLEVGDDMRDVELINILCKLSIITKTPTRQVHEDASSTRTYANYDDIFILELAQQFGGAVISNDRYIDLQSMGDDLRPDCRYRHAIERRRQITFMDKPAYKERMDNVASVPSRRKFYLHAVDLERYADPMYCDVGDRDYAKVAKRQLSTHGRERLMQLLERIESDWQTGKLVHTFAHIDEKTGRRTHYKDDQLTKDLQAIGRDLATEMEEMARFGVLYARGQVAPASLSMVGIDPSLASLLQKQSSSASSMASTVIPMRHDAPPKRTIDYKTESSSAAHPPPTPTRAQEPTPVGDMTEEEQIAHALQLSLLEPPPIVRYESSASSHTSSVVALVDLSLTEPTLDEFVSAPPAVKPTKGILKPTPLDSRLVKANVTVDDPVNTSSASSSRHFMRRRAPPQQPTRRPSNYDEIVAAGRGISAPSTTPVTYAPLMNTSETARAQYLKRFNE